MQDDTEIMKVLETLKCTACHPKSDLIFSREFDLQLGNSRGSSTWISQKAIKI